MPVRIGMISFAHMHAASYAACVQSNPNALLTGISDDDSERGKQMAEAYECEYFGSVDALLEADIDAVIICTENALHRDATLRAAAAGKHVMCEKPISISVEDAQAMINACADAGVGLMTAFPCRYGPAYIEARRLVQQGQVGDILAMKGTNRGRNPGGWFVEPQFSGGGATIDHTVHITDLMRDITGDEVASVYCEMDRFFNPQLRCDDAGLITMDFTGGAIATLDCSWSRPPHYPTWGDATLAVVGTEGNLWIDLFSEKLHVYQNDASGYSWAGYGANLDDGLVDAFCDAVATGAPMPITGRDGLKAMEVALAAYQSAALGEAVTLPL
ncbi:MAG TPA: gfo/Idh/MocA family oxidoreductase [Armatimonadetes bacterium]|nr:gfo/Idh/MocA family oxidoreductase [Armatimonadota bacterium]